MCRLMPKRLYLQDKTLNKNRYYNIHIQRDLFGTFSVIREWGRIDYNGGQVQITPAMTESEAIRESERIEKYRLSRKYTPVLL